MTKSKKKQKTRKTKTTKTTKGTSRATRTRNTADYASDAEPIGATLTDVLFGALPIVASIIAATFGGDHDDADDHTDRVPLCSVCGRVLELPGANRDDRITPFPAYRDLGALFTKAAA